MRKSLLLRSCKFLILLAALFHSGIAFSQQAQWVPGEVLIHLTKDARASDVQDAFVRTLSVTERLSDFKPLGKESRYFLLRIEGATVADQDLEKLVAQIPGVEATSLNYKLKFNAEPNDAQYGTQWNMDDSNVEPVWDFTTGGTMANGKRIGVGISDLAMQTTHPDLSGNIWPGSPAQGGGADHGTEVASVVGAVGNNGIGIAGVNWDVEIVSSGETNDLSDVIEQFEFATTLREQFNASNGSNGLLVVSITASWGVAGFGTCNGFAEPLFTAMADAGILLVASGPNDPISIESGTDFPANCALAEHLVVTSYGPSNETPFAFGPNTVHLLAPGLDIPVATIPGSYSIVDGNSFAIPMVAGAVALLYSVPCAGFAELVMDDPQAARTLVKNAILNNTTPFPGGNALTITGGKLNVFAAYQSLMAQCPVCDTLTVTFASSGNAPVQASLVGGSGTVIETSTSNVLERICAENGCYSATFLDGNGDPVTGTWTVESDVLGPIASGSSADGTLSFNLGNLVSGCTNTNASNYNANANCDDGSCCFGTPIAVLLLADDGTSEGTAHVTVEQSGSTLFDSDVVIAFDPQANQSYGSVVLCGNGSCLTVHVQTGDVALDANGQLLSGPQFNDQLFFPVDVPTVMPGGATQNETCDGVDNDCDGLIDEDFTWYTDADNDGWGVIGSGTIQCTTPGAGFTQLEGDCDDANADINPNMPDACGTADGIDNNCDGNIDEGNLQAWYPDVDGDGFGNTDQVVLACSTPPDHVGADGDCDDSNNNVSPAATEICDGLDNDCDGTVDEGFTWYTDADGDGFGDDATAQASCVPVPGSVQVGGDCDDTDPAVSSTIQLMVVAASEVATGTAHYVVTQGSLVTEGDVVLDYSNEFNASIGEAAICVAQGCFNLSIVEVDVALAQESYIQTGTNTGSEQFLTFDGFFGSAGIPDAELCDGIDNDCDGLEDEDFVWYTDTDGDGVGVTTTAQLSCTPIPGAVLVSGDCNDADPNLTTVGAACDDGDPLTFNDIVRPNCSCLGFVQGSCPPGEIPDCNGNCVPVEWIGDGFCDDGSFEHNGVPIFLNCPEYGNDGGDCGSGCTTEVCDGIDNDCDGQVDEGFPQQYADNDGDGFGDLSQPMPCDTPGVANGDDCDDNNANINPNAVEICDGLDNNCDLQIDEGGVCGCAPAGTPCDDSNACTINETEDGACNCGGGQMVSAGTACDDGNPCSINDLVNSSCACIGTFQDTDGDLTCDALDGCPNDPLKQAPGACGCGVIENDADADGICDNIDTCLDVDGDGYGQAGSSGCQLFGVDCDDLDFAFNPGTLEVCDGIDNNCDLNIDEGGVCGCAPAGTPCDDNNPCTTNDVENGACTCLGTSATESCDGIDNDCDGQIDEGLGLGQSCGCGGVVVCDGNGGVTCSVSVIEICDGLDNDCDGQVDEGFPQQYADNDGDGFGDLSQPMPCDTPGVANADDCDDNNAAIFPGAAEICDGIDNNCDGSVDEGGGCADEICDGIDNDGDGLTDAADPDLVLVFCENQIGVCSGAIKSADRCVNGIWGSCVPEDYLQNSQQYLTGGDVCDGLDNDCDGQVDEGVNDDADFDGFTVCDGDCDDANADINPNAQEICDGIDNNCNGQVDEGFNSCCNDFILEFQSGTGNANAVTYEVLNESGTTTVLSGNNPVPANSIGTRTLCLADGCYQLRVTDAGGDGLVGYVLRETGLNGRRFIDNTGNMSNGTSQISSSGTFCVPMSADELTWSSCDKLDWVNNKYLVCHSNAAVSAEWIVGGANSVQDANSGYEFWTFDPNGTYSYRKFRSHNVSDGFSPATANRAAHMKINNWYNSVLTPLIPQNTLLNVRVRGRVNGTNLAFGPACTMKLDAARAACPLVKLQDDPTNTSDYSCGVTRSFGGTNTAANKITALPPQFSPAPYGGGTGVHFQFRFRIPAEGVCIVLPPQTSPTRYLNWNSTVASPLLCSKTYEVDVRVSKDGGNTWCIGGPANTACSDSEPWGLVCNVTIGCGGSNFNYPSPSNLSQGSLTLYPNPNRGDQLFVTISNLDPDVDRVTMDLFDLTGKRIASRTIAVEGGTLNTMVDISRTTAGDELNDGLYLVQLRAGGSIWNERLIIAH